MAAVLSASTGKKRKLEDSTGGTSSAGSPGPTSTPPTTESAVPQPKKKKAKAAQNNQAAVFSFNSTDLRARQKPVSIADLRNVVLSLAEHTPDQDKPKFLGLPSRASAKRIAVLCIPGITPDIIGMPTPPTFTVSPDQTHRPKSKLHPQSLFAGPAVSALKPPTPAPTPSSGTPTPAPAFPLAFAREPGANQIPAMSRLFSHGLPTRCEGEGSKIYDPVSSFLMGPAKITKKDNSKAESSLFGEQSTTLEALLLSPSELTAEGLSTVLLPSSSSSPSASTTESTRPSPSLHRIANGWGATRSASIDMSDWVRAAPPADSTSPDPEKPVVLALDCEMVSVKSTKDGKLSDKALARIAVVDFWTEEVVFDELVKPDGEIVDYVTQWSGMTPALLDPVTTTLSEIQSRLIATMRDSNAILIGHHISNDLQALKLAHHRLIDTSVIFHNLQRPSSKPSLRWLAQRWLNRVIQAPNQSVVTTKVDETTGEGVTESVPVIGHRPEEDARACVGLVKMKLEQGLAFGKVAESKMSIFTRMKGNGKAKVAGSSSAYVGRDGDTGEFVGTATTCVGCDEDKVLENVSEALKTHDFVFGRVHFLADALGWTIPPSASSSSASPPEPASIFTQFNAQLKSFTTSLPPSTALIIYTGCSDPRPLGLLNKRKTSFESKVRNGAKVEDMSESEKWNAVSDGEELERACEAVKCGLAFFCVTRA